MRIALLGNAGSIHTARWANGLSSCGLAVHVISVHPPEELFSSTVNVHNLSGGSKLSYFRKLHSLRSILKEIEPSLLNAHYASGYGLLARLSGFKPLLLSVWGSDVYDFPYQSIIHKKILADNLAHATAVASTSRTMAEQTRRLFPHPHLFITPFGIDVRSFSPFRLGATEKSNEGEIVIGTVKSLAQVYGIDILIRAFALTHQAFGARYKIRLEIYGDGPQRRDLEQLTGGLGLSSVVQFHGRIDHGAVPVALNGFDIYAALSRSESFGVAVLEACACERPVVVSDADGLAEVVINDVTGLVVQRESVEAAALALGRLIESPRLRRELGSAGREHVLEHYTWDRSLEAMIDTYEKTIDIHNKTGG